MSFTRALIPILGTLIILSCTDMQRVGHSATVHMGVVQNAEPVQLDSPAAKGALVGGMIGLVGGGSGSGAGNAIRGAATGGIAAAAAGGGPRTGMAFTVRMADGSTTRVVTDQHQIQVGDCVAVERAGNTANIRRKAGSFCDPSNADALASAQDATTSAALACEAAKHELSNATGDAQIDRALRKAELLCDS